MERELWRGMRLKLRWIGLIEVSGLLGLRRDVGDRIVAVGGYWMSVLWCSCANVELFYVPWYFDLIMTNVQFKKSIWILHQYNS